MVKFGIGKKSPNPYQKNLVPKKRTGIGIRNVGYGKRKVSVSVSFRILGTVTLWIMIKMRRMVDQITLIMTFQIKENFPRGFLLN